MIRAAVLAVVVVVVVAALTVGLARLRGRSSSAASVLLSVVAQWLGAWALWNLAGGLAVHYGVLSVYDTPLFLVLAAVVGLWHYRTRVRSGPEPARLVFVGAQLVWLGIVLARNGLFGF